LTDSEDFLGANGNSDCCARVEIMHVLNESEAAFNLRSVSTCNRDSPVVRNGRIVFFALGLMIVWMPISCSWSSAGVRRHLVLGIGFVDVATPTESSSSGAAKQGAMIERVAATGILLGPGRIVNGFLLGSTERQSVEISPQLDVLVEALSHREGSFSVTVSNVRGHLHMDAGRIEGARN
jgi:hypothetical protein